MHDPTSRMPAEARWVTQRSRTSSAPIGDAEDAAAEVFALAWRRRDDAEHVLTIGWLYSTLRNVVGNHYRARARHARRVEQTRLNHRTADGMVSDVSLDVQAAV